MEDDSKVGHEMEVDHYIPADIKPLFILSDTRTCGDDGILDMKKCLRGLQLKGKVGTGDFALVSELQVNEALLKLQQIQKQHKYVLKSVELRGPKSEAQFEREVQIGRFLGQNKVSPNIYECWTCSYNVKKVVKKFGYIIMDKIDYIYSNKYPSTLYENSPKNLSRAPQNVEQNLIRTMEKMISLNVIHNDARPENIGIMSDGRVVLFDFGFSVVAKTISHPEQVLMAHLYQCIEKYEQNIMFDSLLYSVIYWIRQGRYTIGASLDPKDYPDLT